MDGEDFRFLFFLLLFGIYDSATTTTPKNEKPGPKSFIEMEIEREKQRVAKFEEEKRLSRQNKVV